VAVGRTDLSSDNEGEEIRVEKEIRHPNYSTSTDEYDIALLLLSRPVQVLTREDMVRINADESFPSPGVMSRTMGWGDTDPDDSKTKVSLDLQEVDLPIISNSECRDAEGTVDGWSDSYRDYIYESMICTFRPGQDACQGDSGGPLIVPGSSASQDILIGVTSWGIGCATRVFPGVFARVSMAYDWIAENVCETSADPPGYMCDTPEPSERPTREPTPEPTAIPTTPSPTSSPTKDPTQSPSNSPTLSPTSTPSVSTSPTVSPSSQPSLSPSTIPSTHPSSIPSMKPSISAAPSYPPTKTPTLRPTVSNSPSITPSPTKKPVWLGGNSLMIPISSLLSQSGGIKILSDEDDEDDEGRTNKDNDDEYDDDTNDGSSCIQRGGLLVGVLMSGILSAMLS